MATIKDLKFDDKNFNRHTEFGMGLLEKSLRETGAGRSILLDKDNNILFALSNPPIVMVHYLKKKCKMAKVTYKHTNRFWLFAVLSGIFAIIALFSGS